MGVNVANVVEEEMRIKRERREHRRELRLRRKRRPKKK